MEASQCSASQDSPLVWKRNASKDSESPKIYVAEILYKTDIQQSCFGSVPILMVKIV